MLISYLKSEERKGCGLCNWKNMHLISAILRCFGSTLFAEQQAAYVNVQRYCINESSTEMKPAKVCIGLVMNVIDV